MSVGSEITKAASKGAQEGLREASSSAISQIFKPFVLLFSKLGWRMSITIILLIFVLIGASIQSIKEKSAAPIFYEVGGRLVSADELIYQKINKLETKPQEVIYVRAAESGFFDRIKEFTSRLGFWFEIITSFWFIYMNFYLFKKLVDVINSTTVPVFINWGWTIAILFTLQMMFSLVFFSVDLMKNDIRDVVNGITEEELTEMSDATAFKYTFIRCIPFKGTISLISYVYKQISAHSPDYVEQIVYLENYSEV